MDASMKATPEDVAKLARMLRQHIGLNASMKATPEDVAKGMNRAASGPSDDEASMKATPEDVAKHNGPMTNTQTFATPQ